VKQAQSDPSTRADVYMMCHKQVLTCLVGLNLREEADLAAYANADFARDKFGGSSLEYIEALRYHAELSRSFSDFKGAIVRLELALEAAKECPTITLEIVLEIYSRLANLSFLTNNTETAINFWESGIIFAGLSENKISIHAAIARVTLAQNLYDLIDLTENNLRMTGPEIRSRIDELLIEATPVLQRSYARVSKQSLASSLLIQGLQIYDRINNGDEIKYTHDDVIDFLAKAKKELIDIGAHKQFQFGDLMLEMAKVYTRMVSILGQNGYQSNICECLKEADSVFSKLPGSQRCENIEILTKIVELMEHLEPESKSAELNNYRRRLQDLRDKRGESNED